jgi:ferric-dicitrate binding protein FerR (iron transport regulator)
VARRHLRRANQQEDRALVQTRIKPYAQEVAENARRLAQLRVYRRNQVIGLLLVAAAVLLVWLLRTNPKWIFPPGWWRP